MALGWTGREQNSVEIGGVEASQGGQGLGSGHAQIGPGSFSTHKGMGMLCFDSRAVRTGDALCGEQGMKMRLDLRDVDAWGIEERQQGRAQLSEDELAQLLADSADSADSL
jgi:hypothetical protein